jgi:hypothetical protein
MLELPWQCPISPEKDPEGRAAWDTFSFSAANLSRRPARHGPDEVGRQLPRHSRRWPCIRQADLQLGAENGAGNCRWFGDPTNFTEHVCRPARVYASEARAGLDRVSPALDQTHETILKAKTGAEGQYPGAKVDMMNPSRLLRRPADYV